MSKMHDDLDITVRILNRVSSPSHTFRSWSLLARRERLTDDKVIRALARSADLAGGDLTQLRENRIMPTPLGIQFRELAERLIDLGRSQPEPVEVIRLGVAPGIDGTLLARVAERFIAEWGGVVSLRLLTVADEIRDALRTGAIHIGLAWTDAEPSEPDQRFEPGIPLVCLVPPGHRLADADGPVTAEHLMPADRLLQSPRAASFDLGNFLDRVPPVNRQVIECHAVHALVARGAWLGLAFAPPETLSGGSCLIRAVDGIEPAKLGLYTPAKLSEPAQFLADAIRTALAEQSLKTSPAEVEAA